MKNKDFDKNIKSTVDKHGSTIDVDSFWASIEGEVKDINEKKKKKRIVPFFFLGLAALSLVSVLSGIYFFDYKNNISIDKSEKQILENQKTKEADLVSMKEELNDVLLFENHNSETSINKNQDLNSTVSNFQESQKTELLFGQNNTDFILETSKNEVETEPKKEFEKVIQKKKIGSPEIIELKTTSLPQASTPFNSFDLENLEFLTSQKHEFNHKKTWEFSLGIQGGINFANRSLEGIDIDTENYIELRNRTESSGIGFQVGLKTGLKHRSGFNFSTGISLTQISERFKFKGSTFKRVMVENGVTAYEITINMDTIPVFGDFEYDQEIVHNTNFKNQYRLFEIPLLIGYQVDFDKWAWGIQTGVFANISMQTTGIIFNPKNEFAYLETEQADFFSSNIGMSYYIGGEGKYSLNDNIALTVSPHFRLFPNSFTNNKNGISQKYSLAGLNLGIDFKF